MMASPSSRASSAPRLRLAENSAPPPRSSTTPLLLAMAEEERHPSITPGALSVAQVRVLIVDSSIARVARCRLATQL